jgi:glycosyltransferase involved in cell wall biosynthesis
LGLECGTTFSKRVSFINMLYICIPAFDEAPTVGLLLWRIRTVFEAHPREYEIIALDDGSTDGTEETLRRYEKVLPLTVLRNETRRGYGAALDTLARAAAKATRYPRRDAMIVMQGDLTDRPEDLPELAKRFDGGVDCVVAEAGPAAASAPKEIRRLRRIAPWLVRRYIRVDGVADPLGTLRLYRIAVIRDVIKQAGDAPIVQGAGWAANVELLVKAAKFCRRIETVPLEPRYDLRPRETRVRWFPDALALYRFGVAHRALSAPAPT